MDEEKASRMFGSAQRQLLGCEYLISLGLHSFSGKRKGGLLEDFKAAMSWDQSPLARSGGVGSNGWALLHRRQDTIMVEFMRDWSLR